MCRRLARFEFSYSLSDIHTQFFVAAIPTPLRIQKKTQAHWGVGGSVQCFTLHRFCSIFDLHVFSKSLASVVLRDLVGEAPLLLGWGWRWSGGQGVEGWKGLARGSGEVCLMLVCLMWRCLVWRCLM